jgi:hypothetical protein
MEAVDLDQLDDGHDAGDDDDDDDDDASSVASDQRKPDSLQSSGSRSFDVKPLFMSLLSHGRPHFIHLFRRELINRIRIFVKQVCVCVCMFYFSDRLFG